MISLSVQRQDFDVGAELAALEALGGGGVASFTGIVRGDGGLTQLQLDHYPGMTERALEAIAKQAMERWPLLGLRVVHRVGGLAPGERIVFVGTASRHRTAALEACAFLIDWLKSKAPFWKKERFADGRDTWVDALPEDEARAEGWIRQ